MALLLAFSVCPVAARGTLLPHGYLSTNGSQIVDSAGHPVRIVSVGWAGGDNDAFVPFGLYAVNYRRTMDSIVAAGFNTIRLPYCDGWVGRNASAVPLNDAHYTSINYALNPGLRGLTAMQVMDKIVDYAGVIGLKIIIDHHGNTCGEGGQQKNGLWYDAHTTPAEFEANWRAWARRYKGNSTVIGYDLDNEPLAQATWGGGGKNDLLAEYTRVGNMIQAIEPGVLIIAEGPQTWHPRPDLPVAGPEGNLSGVRQRPLVLNVPNKVVYSVHEYPPSVAGNGVDARPAAMVARMNRVWGYLVTDGIAPVWVGEMGSSLRTAVDGRWMNTMIDYLNGRLGAEGGPTFSGAQQGISFDWWSWGNFDGWVPDGFLADWDGTPRPDQQAVIDRLQMRPIAGSEKTASPRQAATGAAEEAAGMLRRSAEPAR